MDIAENIHQQLSQVNNNDNNNKILIMAKTHSTYSVLGTKILSISCI